MKMARGICRFGGPKLLGVILFAACASTLLAGACTTSEDGLAFEGDDGPAGGTGNDGVGLFPGGGGNVGGQAAAPDAGLGAMGGTSGAGAATAAGGTVGTGGARSGGAGAGNTGGMRTAGMNAGGMRTAGMNAGGTNTGGTNTGGMNTGGMNTGGMNTGGMNTGGMNTGGMNTGGTIGSRPFEGTPSPEEVVCGDDTCDDGDVCCFSEGEARCVGSPVLCPPPAVLRGCDDRSDCDEANFVCCGGVYQGSLRSACLRRTSCSSLTGTFTVCANSTQCQGEQSVCCAQAFADMTAGVCRASCD